MSGCCGNCCDGGYGEVFKVNIGGGECESVRECWDSPVPDAGPGYRHSANLSMSTIPYRGIYPNSADPEAKPNSRDVRINSLNHLIPA
jgi:hypothetical protein